MANYRYKQSNGKKKKSSNPVKPKPMMDRNQFGERPVKKKDTTMTAPKKKAMPGRQMMPLSVAGSGRRRDY